MENELRTMTVSETVRISGVYDVVVCGGGPAGIAAAIASARKGASTLLIEQLSYLGGMASGSFINAWCDTQTGPIAAELEARLTDLGAAARNYDPEKHLCETGRMTFQSHMMAAVSLRMLHEAGAEVLFGTVAEGVWLDRGKVTGVFIANKNGRSLVQASVVIDATADGDMAVSAGADFMRGDPDDGRIQHVHYRFRISGAEHIAAAQKQLSGEELLNLVRKARDRGDLTPPSGMFRPCAETFPYQSPERCLYVNRWEIDKVDPSDAQAVSRCLVECQLAALQVMEFCQKRLPGCSSCRIDQLPGLLGTRESRRILGEHVLCKDDVLSGRKFEDGIAKCCFFFVSSITSP